MIIAIISFIAGLVTGLLVSRKHRAKLESAEAKTRSLLDVLKGR